MTPDEVGKVVADRFMGSSSHAYSGEVGLALHISSAIQQAIAAEREACAVLVEQSEVFCEHGCTDRIAALIRNST